MKCYISEIESSLQDLYGLDFDGLFDTPSTELEHDLRNLEHCQAAGKVYMHAGNEDILSAEEVLKVLA